MDSGVCLIKGGLMLAVSTHCSSQFSYLTGMTLPVVVTRENRGKSFCFMESIQPIVTRVKTNHVSKII